MAQTLLEVTDLQVELENQILLHGINFEVKANETLAIIGPNGAGKTTLFRAILGLIPYTGTVRWQKDIKIGYVPQKLYIEPDLPLTVAEFFALKRNRVKKSEIEQSLVMVGYIFDNGTGKTSKKALLHKKLGVLSGGELQRILVAWTLVDKPEVLLFDEPTAGIDISAEETIYSLLHRLQEKEQMTIILISHELQIVYKYATNVLCLNKKGLCLGPPKEVLDREGLVALFGRDIGFYQHH